MSYFEDIQAGVRTTLKGLSLTFRHLRQATHRRTPEGIANPTYFDQQNGLVTLQYPHEQLPIPDNGRYRLRNEIDDCIVCDKCAKVCPVDCITIDAIKATEEVGRASDGSPIRLYAATFDIDMAKCCYCGLCTVVCPTECLTMDKTFDYSTYELGKLTYHFADLTPAEADEKRALYEQFVREKEAQKAAQVAAKAPVPSAEPTARRPVFRPSARPAAAPDPTENSTQGAIDHPLTDATPDEMQQIAQGGLETKKRPVFKPTQKPAAPPENADLPAPEPATPRPAFRPTMKPAQPAKAEPVADEAEPAQSLPSAEAPKKPAFRPTMKPAKPAPDQPAASPEPTPAPPESATNDNPAPVDKPARPVFRPTMRPKPTPPTDESA